MTITKGQALALAREEYRRALASGASTKEAQRAYARVRQRALRADPETLAEHYRRTAERLRNPEVHSRYKMRKRQQSREARYGLSNQEFENMVRAQSGRCKICHTMFNEKVVACVDHNHRPPYQVRGILCEACNYALGHAKDDRSVIASAVAYLLRPRPHIPDLPPPKPMSTRDRALRYNHGITTAELKALHDSQNGKCPITGTPLPLSGSGVHVDHDHQSEGRAAIRGLLSLNANALLGKARDSVIILESMVDYLASAESASSSP